MRWWTLVVVIGMGGCAACGADGGGGADARGETESESEPHPESEFETEFETENENENETEFETESESESEPEPESESESEPEPESESETESESGPETESESEIESESESETESESGPETAVTPAAPLVLYTLGGPRRLYFLNNPEQLVLADLGDAALGDHTLLRVTAGGAGRSFFEHLNKTGRTIGFGIQVYNPGPSNASVTVVGTGWTVGIAGGVPFADALAGVGAAAPVVLGPGKSAWILRRDEVVPPGSFFSGVVDFDVAGAEVIVNHIAYDAFAGLDGSTSELGYVQRIEPDGTHEARMYKGTASASEAATALSFVIDDATAPGALPVDVRAFDLAASTYGDPHPASAWITHIGPAQNAAAVASDMVALTLPAWGVFDPFAISDGDGKYPNLGNWGVVTTATIDLANHGTRARTAALRLTTSPGAGAGFAVRADDGIWTAMRIDKDTSVDLATGLLPAGGTLTLRVAFVLGGPSGGALRQAVVVD